MIGTQKLLTTAITVQELVIAIAQIKKSQKI